MKNIRKELKIRWKLFKACAWLFYRKHIAHDKIVGYKSIKCPVCGTKTLDSFWICPRCWFEYEDFCEEPPDDLLLGIDVSLNEYKKLYKEGKPMTL